MAKSKPQKPLSTDERIVRLMASEKRSHAVTDLDGIGILVQVFCHTCGDGVSFWAHNEPEAYKALEGKHPPLRASEVVGEVEAIKTQKSE